MESYIRDRTLASLYLRLNGFFVSQFIVHSARHGRVATELDAVAVRLPFNEERQRLVDPDPLLELSSEYTDLVLCEVKSKRQQLRFNDAFANSAEVIETVLRWAGPFPPDDVTAIAQRFRSKLAHHDADGPATIYGPGRVRIRALLFSPERSARRPNQPWFVTGSDVIGFVVRCLSPANRRDSCATNYDFQVWGRHEVLVRCFKEIGSRGPADISELYARYCKLISVERNV